MYNNKIITNKMKIKNMKYGVFVKVTLTHGAFAVQKFYSLKIFFVPETSKCLILILFVFFPILHPHVICRAKIILAYTYISENEKKQRTNTI